MGSRDELALTPEPVEVRFCRLPADGAETATGTPGVCSTICTLSAGGGAGPLLYPSPDESVSELISVPCPGLNPVWATPVSPAVPLSANRCLCDIMSTERNKTAAMNNECVRWTSRQVSLLPRYANCFF